MLDSENLWLVLIFLHSHCCHPGLSCIVICLDYGSSLLMAPCFHLQPLDPIVHAEDKGVFTKDKLNQVAPWIKLLLTCCTLNKTYLLTVAPKILCYLSLPNLSDCSFNHPLPHSLDSMTSLTFPTRQACSSPKAFTWAAPSALNNLGSIRTLPPQTGPS